MPDALNPNPRPTIDRVEVLGKTFGLPIAETSSAKGEGKQTRPSLYCRQTPVLPRAVRDGTTQEEPIWTQELEEEERQSANKSRWFDHHRGRTGDHLPRFVQVSVVPMKTQKDQTARTSQTTGEKPSQSVAQAWKETSPHSEDPKRQIQSDARPNDRKSAPTISNRPTLSY